MKKILVIEDAKSLRNEVVSILVSHGYSVKGAEDGRSGFALAKEFFPDLIICDILMPDIDGYEVLRNLRQDKSTSTIPFIFTTVKSDRDDIRKGMTGGADDYLIKPFSAKDLVSAVESQFEKQRKFASVLESMTKERLTHLLSVSPSVIYSFPGTDFKGFTFISDNIKDLLGYDREAFIKSFDFWYEIIHPEDRERVFSNTEQILKKSSLSLEYRVLHRSGTYLWLYDEKKIVENNGIPETVGSLLDITDIKEAEEALILRLKMEEIISEISTNFINISPSEFDIQIRDGLKKIGEFVEADSVSFVLFSKNFKRFDVVYDWYSHNKKRGKKDYRDLKLNSFTWAFDIFSMGRNIHIPSLSEIPPEGKREKEFCLSQGIKSFLVIPAGNEDLKGFMGFTSHTEEKSWKEDDIRLLKVAGDIFLNAFERKKSEDHINRWNLMEGLITNIAIRFININNENLDRNITHSLQVLGEFSGADRVYIYTISSDGLNFREAFDWCVPECKKVENEVKKLDPGLFKWLRESFTYYNYVNIPSVAELPPEAEYEKNYWGSQGIKSILILPLKVRDRLLGCFGFSTEREEKHWDDFHIRLLRMTGEIFTNVIIRKDTKKIPVGELKERSEFYNMVGKSPSMQSIYRFIEDLADIQSNILITGESGTGKELVAQAIHYKGIRRHKPFVSVNCSALPENLQESELFGHVKGAFTGAIKTQPGRFQKAHGGTIFLDEIGDVPLSLQVKLLRVLQEKEFERVGDPDSIKVNVRIIAATNQELPGKIKEGTFRRDLYYRLKVVEIKLPPLRKRMEDLPLLIEHFRNKLNRELNKDIKFISPEVIDIFMNYSWPGNVRELQHTLEASFISCREDIITPKHLPPGFQEEEKPETDNFSGICSGEEKILRETLEKVKWNKAKAAKLLGMSRPTFYKKLKLYGIGV